MSPKPEKDGWFAHHQHRPCFEACTVCLRGISNPRLVALAPHRERLQGFTGDGATCTDPACSTFPLPPTGSASPGGPLKDSVGVVRPNRHRLRLGNSTGVHHCQINDSHSGASQLHLPCGEFHTRGAVASPSMYHSSCTCTTTPHSNRSPLGSGTPAPAQAHSVPSPPMPAQAEEMVMIPTWSVPHPPCGKGCAESLDEPGRAPPQFHTHHSPSRPHSVPLPHSELGSRSRSSLLGYVPSGSCPLRPRR